MSTGNIDFTSDLNDGSDVSAHGADTVHVNDAVTPHTDRTQPTKVGTPKADDGEKPKPLSLRDQISSALRGGEGEETPPAARARNPDGTFAAATPAAPGTAEPAPTEGAPAAAAPVQVPHGLVGFTPETFGSLPAETQAELARTMEELAQAQQYFDGLNSIEQLIAPRRQAWALNGMTEAQALGQLFALSDFASRDMAGFIKYMAQNGGVNLEDLVLAAEPVDPRYAALEREVAELRGAQTQAQTHAQQIAHQNTVNSVVVFAEEKGPDGNPLRPYFSELGQTILPHISAVQAQNPTWSQAQILQAAYENACWGTPSVRAKMQAAADAAAEAERLRTEAARVDKARAAGVSVRSGAPTSPAPTPADGKMSLRETIRASMAAAS
jgi:hypothetical protein